MATIRYRQNIDCLTEDQLHDLRAAWQGLYDLADSDPHSYATLAGLHGDPSPSYCVHGYPGFLTWHRAYIEAFERALQRIDCDVMLPYWDWSSGPTTGVPSACAASTYVDRSGATVANPLYRGPRPGGGFTARRVDIDTTSFDDLATSATNALTFGDFDGFQAALNGVHGAVHGRVGGQMGSVPNAAFDPIFWLHHCNVDRLWAEWQKAHSDPLPSDEATLELEPFNRPFTSDWRTGAELFSTDDLGYRYMRFCFRLPPIRDWRIFVLPIDSIRDRIRTARIVLQSDRMAANTVELRVFVGQPEADDRTPTAGNPHFAGTVGLFGMGRAQRMNKRRSERFDLAVDVSRALRELDRRTDEVAVTIVPVGVDGARVAPERVEIRGVEVLVD